MDGTCRTYVTDEKCMSPGRIRSGTLRELCCELDCSDLMAGSCGSNNKHSGYINGGNLFNQINDFNFSGRIRSTFVMPYFT